MNAQQALKHAATCGSEAMLHAVTLAKRRETTAAELASWHPALVLGLGFAAGALLGRVVASHPKLSGAGAFVLALARATPADRLWQMWLGDGRPGTTP